MSAVAELAAGARSAYLRSFGEGVGYLDFARVGPLSRAVIDARGQACQQLLDPTPGTVDTQMAFQQSSMTTAAAIAGLSPTDFVYVPNTSIGLFQVAFALTPHRQRDEVLLSREEFPSNIYPWVRAAEAGRLRPRFLTPSGDLGTAGLIAENLTERTAAVSVSAVDFRTGHRTDLGEIRSIIGDRWLIVDGIQAFGAVGAEWSAADALVVGGQKWLRSGWGTGFVAVSQRLAGSWEPLLSGWTGVADPSRYDGAVHARLPGAAALSITNLSPIDQSAFAAGLALVQSVGIDWIESRITGIAGRFAQELRSAGAEVVGDPGGRAGSGIIPFSLPGRDLAALHRRLTEAGVSSTLHAGTPRIRVSVHATTTDDSIPLVTEVVRAASRT